MTTPPDSEELALKDRLIRLIDGPRADAQPDAVDAAAAAAVAQPSSAPAASGDAPRDGHDEPQQGTTDEEPAPSGKVAPDRPQPWWTGRATILTLPRKKDVEDDVDEEDVEDAEGEEEPDDDFDTPDAEDDVDDEETDADDADAQPKKRRPRLRIPNRPRNSPRRPAARSGAIVAAPAPRMSLLDAYGNIPPRIRWLGVHASAAAAGYYFGWVQYWTRYSAWLDEHGWNNLNGYFWVGCAIGCELLRRRTRHSILLLRLAFAVPIASIVTGTLLYGTGWQHLELPL